MKDRAGSSSGSQEGRTESGEEGSVSCWSGFACREEIFLFFEEDVVKVSCPGSSRRLAGWLERTGLQKKMLDSQLR